MQFIPNGPEVPDALLQAHEEGRVVFFCGAGISRAAGLPDFRGLVKDIYRRVGTSRKDIEEAAFKRGEYDTVLNLLEQRLPGGRLAMRRALAGALKPTKPKLPGKGATDTHAALLRLARDRDGALRLVTTNFDRVFHVAAKRSGQVFQAHAAPMLPIPKNSRWNGLVYLHGLLPGKADDAALNRLVVTSGDFGLAYLTERWAARFLSELFRNYVVCFVGYSINDLVLRYMMDALAADRMLGDATPQAWALGDCEPGQEARKAKEWKAKGVEPILYPVPAGTHDHSALHQTLQAWAETYRDGVTGKERIVVAHALARPSASTQQDDFVGRMLWALSDPSGRPAKRFAEFDPVPSLEWLFDAFAIDRFGHNDLTRFGVPPREEPDSNLRFSLVTRPAPYWLSPPMRLVAGRIAATQWDDVMFQLARWLLRHLNDPRLVLWITERGEQLHERWIWLIENKLDELARLERDGKTFELEEIRANAPHAIPGPLMRILWRLLLSGRVKSSPRGPDLFSWKSRLKREGLTATLRLELREMLSPKVRLSEPLRWGEELASADEPTRLRQLVNWELVLAADDVRSALHDLADAQWQAALPTLLDDMQLLLRDALDLLREMGEADERRDDVYVDLPSISSHPQNDGIRDWVYLIELLRDAWLAVRSMDSARAARVAASWFELPYPTFKRLALFAASQEDVVAPEQWVKWLLADSAWWLWTIDTRREVMRLLVLQGRQLTSAAQQRLESAILAGPPRDGYGGDLVSDGWEDFEARSVWLRLAKLSASGLVLGDRAAALFRELSERHPNWQLAANEHDEFPTWISATGDPDFESERRIEVAPRTWKALVSWLPGSAPGRPPFDEDTWHDVCRTRFFHSWYALCKLAGREVWPVQRWREALRVWSEEGLVLRSWRYAAPLVETMPDTILKECARGVSWWLQRASKSLGAHDDRLVPLCQRILDLLAHEGAQISGDDGQTVDRPVTAAINHPIGLVTEALINRWSKRTLNDDEGLPADIALLFTRLCDVRVRGYRHGRVLLASRLIALFRVDRRWTEQYLLPRFDWEANSGEASALWQGFLWAGRIYGPLLVAFKSQFLNTAHHYRALGESGRRFAAFLTYAALERIEGYTVAEWRAAFAALPPEALRHSAYALVQALDGAADRREEHWKNRIRPFWKEVWPKSRDLLTLGISESLARLCVAAGTEFPRTLEMVQDWLQPIEHPYDVIDPLLESGLCSQFPSDSLQLLATIVRDSALGCAQTGGILGSHRAGGPEPRPESELPAPARVRQ